MCLVITGKKVVYNGRPAAIRPMSPWRATTQGSGQRHIPQFSQKRGRKPSRCLAKNSLLPALMNFHQKSQKVISKLHAATDVGGHGEGKLVCVCSASGFEGHFFIEISHRQSSRNAQVGPLTVQFQIKLTWRTGQSGAQTFPAGLHQHTCCV